MKSITTPGNPSSLPQLRSLEGEGQKSSVSGPRPQLKVVDNALPEKPRLPPESPSAKIRISEEGRAMLSKLAAHTEQELMEEPSEATISRLVAEGIEEGFFD